MKKKKEIEASLKKMREAEHNLTSYDLGWRAGYRNALTWVLERY